MRLLSSEMETKLATKEKVDIYIEMCLNFSLYSAYKYKCGMTVLVYVSVCENMSSVLLFKA